MHSYRYGHMLQEYNLANVRAAIATREERLEAIRTRRDAEKYAAMLRRKVRKIFGPFPKKTPLEAEVTGRLNLGKVAIEKVIFQSRPGFYVTGNLYLPHNMDKKNPAVIGLCGHSGLGKAEPLYQSFSQALAMKGFIVFIIDPICQGERRQFFPRDGGKRPGLCHAHNLLGNKMLLRIYPVNKN